jgi:hypothetical protein
MKYKKLIWLSLILLFFCAGASFCFAWENPKIPQEQIQNQDAKESGETKADSNSILLMYSPQMVQKEGNTLAISFSLQNGDLIQPGIRYGVVIYKDENGAKIPVDRFISDEIITLDGNEKIKKEISYVSGGCLSGKYQVSLEIANTSGWQLAQKDLGEAIFKGNGSCAEIKNSACKIIDESGNESSLEASNFFEYQKNYALRCPVSGAAGLKARPVMEIFQGTAYGEADAAIKGDVLDFSKTKEAGITLDLPGFSTREKHFWKLYLADENGVAFSRPVFFYSIFYGNNGQIYNTRLDKNSYAKGKNAKIYIDAYSFSASADKKMEPLKDSILTAGIFNSDGQNCLDGSPTVTGADLLEGGGQAGIIRPVKIDCPSPRLEVTFEDKGGSMLDQEKLSLQNEIKIAGENRNENGQVRPQASRDRIKKLINGKNAGKVFLAVILLAVLIMFIKLAVKKIRLRNYRFFGFWLVFFLFMFFGINNARANCSTRTLDSTNNLKIKVCTELTGYAVGEYVTLDATVINAMGNPAVTHSVRMQVETYEDVSPTNPPTHFVDYFTQSFTGSAGNVANPVNISIGGTQLNNPVNLNHLPRIGNATNGYTGYAVFRVYLDGSVKINPTNGQQTFALYIPGACGTFNSQTARNVYYKNRAASIFASYNDYMSGSPVAYSLCGAGDNWTGGGGTIDSYYNYDKTTGILKWACGNDDRPQNVAYCQGKLIYDGKCIWPNGGYMCNSHYSEATSTTWCTDEYGNQAFSNYVKNPVTNTSGAYYMWPGNSTCEDPGAGDDTCGTGCEDLASGTCQTKYYHSEPSLFNNGYYESGPWTWSCAGSGGGADAGCSTLSARNLHNNKNLCADVAPSKNLSYTNTVLCKLPSDPELNRSKYFSSPWPALPTKIGNKWMWQCDIYAGSWSGSYNQDIYQMNSYGSPGTPGLACFDGQYRSCSSEVITDGQCNASAVGPYSLASDITVPCDTASGSHLYGNITYNSATSKWEWQCLGNACDTSSSDCVAVSCSAARTPQPASCGSDSNRSQCLAPAGSLCGNGGTPDIAGITLKDNKYHWICDGTGGNANCEAPKFCSTDAVWKEINP